MLCIESTCMTKITIATTDTLNANAQTTIEKNITAILPATHIDLNWVKNMFVNSVLPENAIIICDYVIAMEREANISISTRRNC